MTRPFVVVGAGPSGLGAALALVDRGPVEVVDRIPVAGGSHGWTGREIRDLVRAGERAGIRFRLGETACRWDRAGRLLLAAPGRISTIDARHLYFAGGLRPATAAELHIAGDRPAGVLPASVAEHLLQTRVALWQRPVIVGDGPWSAHLAETVRGYGGTPVVLPKPGPEMQLRVEGRVRVQVLHVTENGVSRAIPGDAVILAADPRPVRNVEGALDEAAPGVTYVQPGGTTPTERADAARELVRCEGDR
ncbi:hypothetical protein [Amycolatopsis jejuensis]|uniref:hypothetical protein n=1 Tax=Amycolatopsis jejuensis TaxID=330084 RepID=UPI000689DC11|nr:hypothetical protein [Amycolatopsis jejuensis]